MKKIFSAKKWEEDNADLKKDCKWLYDLARMTYVQDCDGEEVVNGKVKGKTGAEYTMDGNVGILEETPELEKGYEKPVPYEIVIRCDGKTTTAEMKVDGKVVRESSSRKCPEDKFDFRVGAEYAFNRLFKKERKVYKVGDVVRIRKNLHVNVNEMKSEYDGCFVTSGMKNFFGKKVKIVEVDKERKNRYRVAIKGKETGWFWTAEMFEKNPCFEIGDRVIVSGVVKESCKFLNGKHGEIVRIEKNVFEPSVLPYPADVATVKVDKTGIYRIYVERLKHE